VVVTFIAGGNREYPEKTTDLQHVTDTQCCIARYTSSGTRFEHRTLVVIGTDYLDSCKSSYYTITSMTAPPRYKH